MAFSEEKAVEDLTEIYRKSFEKQTKKIINAKVKGLDIEDTRIAADVNRILKSLEEKNKQWAGKVVPKIYGRTREEIMGFYKKHNIVLDEDISFRKIHQNAVVELQKNLYDELNNGIIQIGRKTKDRLKEITEETTKIQMAGGSERAEAIKEASEKIANEGLQHITYANGAKVNITKYVEMATKTTSSAAINRATVNQQLQYKQDLIKISFHSTSCPICAPFQDRIYSLKTENTEYPHISQINEGAFVNYGTIHPNCRHRALPYILTLDDNKEKNKKESNKPFADNRSEFGKERYEKRQKVNGINRKIDKLGMQRDIAEVAGEKDLVRDIDEKINRLENETEEIRQWEIDGLQANQLFE